MIKSEIIKKINISVYRNPETHIFCATSIKNPKLRGEGESLDAAVDALKATITEWDFLTENY